MTNKSITQEKVYCQYPFIKEDIETEINFYKQQTATGIIEIGKRLIEAKELLKHGEWGKWLEETVDFSETSAKRFMQVAREFSNSPALGDLSKSKVFALLSIPQDQREEFIQSHDIESLTTRQLQEEIKKAKEEAKRESEELYKQKENEYQNKNQELESRLKELQESIDIWSIVDKNYDENVYQIKINELKPFPNHENYFWNMEGKNYIDFLTSIETSGVINPIIITRDNIIISGHQRVRACKDLGIDTIPTRYFHSDNPQGRNLDNLLLNAFISSNMHTRTSVFWLACVWQDLYFGKGKKVDYYKQKFIEHDDKKLEEWLNQKQLTL